jgi:hypothetical protein
MRAKRRAQSNPSEASDPTAESDGGKKVGKVRILTSLSCGKCRQFFCTACVELLTGKGVKSLSGVKRAANKGSRAKEESTAG